MRYGKRVDLLEPRPGILVTQKGGIMDKVMFSSKSNLWSTPQDFFNELNREFNFTLDPCATPENAKCTKYYTETDNGLKQDWGAKRCFVILHTEKK